MIRARIITVLSLVSLLGGAGSAFANHAWGSFHWARTVNPFTVKLSDNLSSSWDSYLTTSSADWSISTVLDTTIVSGTTNPKTCRPSSGIVAVCNSKYGNNGWLGIASIWASGDHITQGTVRMNDTYFSRAPYTSPAWKNLVLCQEVGHTLGLDHQDEDFGNAPLGTCMDYSSDPTLNQHPNAHDYEMLATIYAHLDSFTTLKQTTASKKDGEDLDALDEDFSDPKAWGKEIRRSKDGRTSLYEREIGKGKKVVTSVFWAEGERGNDGH